MTTMTTVSTRLGFVLAAALLAISVGSPAQATYRERCGPNEQTQVETKGCPDMRPNYTRTRVCCTRTTNKGTKTRCKPWAHCPKPSRS